VPEEAPAVPPAARRLIAEIADNESLFGIDKEGAERRVAHHWTMFDEKKNRRAASLLLAAITDLPARWIEDISGGRR
jgi:hypothetical protein